jgi:hypothetical protein
VWGSYIIPNGSVTTAKLAANAVTAAQIANGAVGQAQIANGAVGQAQIVARSGFTFTITSASATSGWQYTNNNQTFTLITTISPATTAYFAGTGAPSVSGMLTCVVASGCSSNIAYSAFTNGAPNALAGGIASSASSGSYTNATESYTQITNMSLSLVTLGNPVMIMLLPFPGSSGTGAFDNCTSATISCSFYITAYGGASGSTLLAEHVVIVTGASANPMQLQTPFSSFQWMDFPSAGTWNYVIKAKANNANNSIGVQNAMVVAYEIK